VGGLNCYTKYNIILPLSILETYKNTKKRRNLIEKKEVEEGSFSKNNFENESENDNLNRKLQKKKKKKIISNKGISLSKISLENGQVSVVYICISYSFTYI
jgi:hypothetical protein